MKRPIIKVDPLQNKMVKRCLIKVDPLQAEQQLGFPAGATAGASSLDTAAPTVSFFHIREGLKKRGGKYGLFNISHLSLHSATHLAIIPFSIF